jgi:Mrp family chromosome partitioning ATPase
MARILDAQRLAEAKHLAPEAISLAADAARVVPDESETVSYIEVGGTAIGLQASADVLASPAPPSRKIRSAPALTPAEPPRTVLSETGPLYVAFQQWPATPSAPYPELVSYHRPEHHASEAYRAVLGQILSGDFSTLPQTIGITGLAPGVGATTALLNMAVCATREGNRRVAVLDLNAARPAVARWLGVAQGPGIDEFLSGRVSLEKALHPTRVSGLFVLATCGGADKAVRPSPEAIRWIATWLRQRFDLIFLDAGTWEEASSVVLADAVYLVTPIGSASSPRLSQVAREIARQGGRLRGILQTDIQT